MGGTVVCLRWRPRRPLAVAVVGSAALVLPLLALGLGLALPGVLVGAVLAGVGLDIAIVAWTTVFQAHVPVHELGRMSSFNNVGERLAIPVGYLLTALASHAWPPRTVLLACAAVIVAATVANLCVRDVRRIGRTPDEDPDPGPCPGPGPGPRPDPGSSSARR
ncbi:MFS transporter [Streptomyces sp. NPDC002851]